jgi:hypothetical protein
MRQPVAEVIRNARRENLRFVFETPERPRVNGMAKVFVLQCVAVRANLFPHIGRRAFCAILGSWCLRNGRPRK